MALAMLVKKWISGDLRRLLGQSPREEAHGTPKRVFSRLVAKTSEMLLPSDMLWRMRTEREWKRWVDSLTPEILEDLTHAPMEAKRQIFKAHVRRVEIETHAKCNRICSFCPNVIVDRRRNKTLTDAQMLDRVFRELGSIDYANGIVVARYSEPLANPQYLYEQIARARALVPHCKLAITTNTDYLTPAVLDSLREAGLNVVYMSLYLKPRETWTLELAHAYSERLAKKLSARLITKRETATSLQCTYEYEGLDLYSTCHNWDEYGTDRGAVIERYTNRQRLGPCRDPFETFVIDYSGAVMPCCNLRSDFPEHHGFIAGDLSVPGTSIFDVYAGQLSGWRRSMVGFGKKASPCTTCLHRDVPEALIAPVAIRLEKRLREIDCSDYYESPPK